MGVKTIVAIIVIIGVASAGGAYWYFQHNGSGSESDYTLLDSQDNIKTGFTVVGESKGDHSSSYSKYVVNSVTGDLVNYSLESKTTADIGLLSTICSLSDFTPNGRYIPFNYTGSTTPSGITVTTSGNTYTINGSYTDGGTYEYDNLVVVYKLLSVSSVDGKVSLKVNDSGKSAQSSSQVSMVSEDIFDLSTSYGVLGGTFTENVTQTYERNIDSFCRRALPSEFDASDVAGATILTSDGKLGNVDVKIYTINGTVKGKVLKDCVYYVYSGYVIKSDVNIDGEKSTLTYSVYMS